MEQSPRLSLSYVAPSQAQKHVTVNETFRRLDVLTQCAVRSRTETAEPATPADGDVYIIPSGASGAAWDDFTENNLAAFQDGAWSEIAAVEGFCAWVAADDEFIAFDGAVWSALSGGGTSQTAAKLGVNTTADATNKLAVKSDAVLFNHDDATPGSGDCQVKINKDAAGDTGSLLFQTGTSGRAECGLTGDDNFHLKVSPDGAAWNDALFIDKDSADIGIGTDAPDKKLHILCTGNNDGFVLETSHSAGGRIGFDLVTGYTANAGDFFRFNFRGDHADLILAVWDASAAGFVSWIAFDYLGEETTFEGAMIVGSPTGGGKGAGTINAQAVYDDNALLTCYVFDQVLDGDVNLEKWDAKAPTKAHPDQKSSGKKLPGSPGKHEPLRKFTARIGGAYDPLTLDGYAKHWREKRHLTSMPNEATFDIEKGMATGEWIQRLVETVEIQAVLIEELNQRLKALEAGL
ncbi:DUF2793 domain-containing protein [Hyphococcus sp.]|uniref:DUF2793 domain-containing protein n=1 Tax=Hyphococcus sp. TaxID=2038636 RepID=UPI003CCBA73B